MTDQEKNALVLSLLSPEFTAIIDKLLDSGIGYQHARRLFKYHYMLRALARNEHNISKTARNVELHRNLVSRYIDEAREFIRTYHRTRKGEQ